VTSALPPVTGSGPAGSDDDDAARWREAVRLRGEHPGWIVLWLAYLQQYRAYPLVQDRHRTIMTAAVPEDLATLIRQAEQASPRRPPLRSTAAVGQEDRP
jgi:hypothetical protein